MTAHRTRICLAIFAVAAPVHVSLSETLPSTPPVPNNAPLVSEFVVPVTRQIRADEDARRRVLEFLRAYRQEKESSRAEGVQRIATIDPDSPDVDKRSAAELHAKEEAKNRQLHAALALCKQTAGTEAGLTSVLLLAAIASHDRPKGQRPNLSPITNALEAVRRDFPDTWQGKVAPLLQATLMKQSMSLTGRRSPSSILAIVDWLKRTTPAREDPVDLNAQDVSAFRAVYPLFAPLKVNYLRSIANTQVEAGTVAALDDAVKTCAEIIALYPNTEHAKWAKWLAEDQIPALRETMK